MDGVDLQAFANVFANSMVIISAGAVCAYLGLNRFFPLRAGSIRLFIAYFLAKATIWSFYDAAFFFGIEGEGIRLSWVVLMAVMSILTYAVVYITWESSILKIALVALLVDSVSGFVTVAALAVTSMLFSGEVVLDYIGYVRPQTFAFVVCQILLFVVLIRILSPIGYFICDFKFKRERLWTAVFLVAIVLAASTRTQAVSDSAVVYVLMAAFAVLLVVPHALWRGRMARRQRMLLARAQALARAYDDSLRNQVSFLTESRQLLDELANRIESVDAGVDDADLSEHMDALRKSCDSLRYGTYSDNPALDVMLVSWESRFATMGVPVEYRIAPLPRGGAQVALAVQALFEWVFRECAIPDSVKKKPYSVPEGLILRVFHSANQQLIELRIFAWKGPHFPRTRISERMPSQALSVREYSEGTCRVVRVIVEEEASWNS